MNYINRVDNIHEEAVSRKLGGVHVNFLRKIMEQKRKRLMDGTCRSEAASKVLKEAFTQTPGSYIDKRQAMVAEWVMLRKILDICDRETGYKGGGGRCELWWRKMASRKQLGATLEDISEAERAWRSEPGRRGQGRGGR